jgi:hypothetical protein
MGQDGLDPSNSDEQHLIRTGEEGNGRGHGERRFASLLFSTVPGSGGGGRDGGSLHCYSLGFCRSRRELRGKIPSIFRGWGDSCVLLDYQVDDRRPALCRPGGWTVWSSHCPTTQCNPWLDHSFQPSQVTRAVIFAGGERTTAIAHVRSQLPTTVSQY